MYNDYDIVQGQQYWDPRYDYKDRYDYDRRYDLRHKYPRRRRRDYYRNYRP